MTVFGKGDPSGMNLEELGCFWACAPESRCGRPDWVDIFVNHVEKIQKNNKRPGPVGFGGLVTLIVQHKGISIPDQLPKVPYRLTPYLDLESLRSCHLVDYVNPPSRHGVYLRYKGTKKIPLVPRGAQFRITEHFRMADMWKVFRDEDDPEDPLDVADRTAYIEEEEELEDEEDDGADEENDGDDDDFEMFDASYDPSYPSGSSAGPSGTLRQQMQQQYIDMSNRVDNLQSTINAVNDNIYNLHNSSMYDLQTQFTTLNMYGEAAMSYYASGGVDFQDPRAAAEEMRQKRESEREAWLKMAEEARRKGDPGCGPSGPRNYGF